MWMCGVETGDSSWNRGPPLPHLYLPTDQKEGNKVERNTMTGRIGVGTWEGVGM